MTRPDPAAGRPRHRDVPAARCRSPTAAREPPWPTPQLRRNLRHATHDHPRQAGARSSASCADWEELRRGRRGDQGRRRCATCRDLPRAARGGGDRARRHRALGARRRRGQPRSSPTSCEATGADEVVKVKSMATQEIGLNEALAAAGHRRLRDRPRRADRPARPTTGPRTSWCRRSTATAPRSATSSCARWPTSAARHPTTSPTTRPAGRGRPAAPAREVPAAPRSRSRGANFAVAETGTLAVVESEGNGRMCLTLPETLITVMGIEKLVPTLARPRGVPAAAAALARPASG